MRDCLWVVEQWLGVRLMLSNERVVMCCGAVARCAHRPTAPQHIPTQHDMLPQNVVCKYELNCEYRNITLARN